MSLNDPQWGKRGNQNGGPPDLDEIWRNVNRRMNDLFGRKREPQDGGEGGRPGARLPLGGAGMLVALILVDRENGTAGMIELLKRPLDYKRIKSKIWYLPMFLVIPFTVLVQ